jgi:hypothetical protein
MDYAKSSSGRIIWTVDQGRLHENGQDIKFALTATDTKTLLDLLKRNEEAITRAAAQEQHAVGNNT